jgi:hypothetical protein
VGPYLLTVVEAVDMGFRSLGFDMEWRFYWSNGKTVSRRTALVQIGDDRIILLVQLSAMTRELGVLCCDQSSMICVFPCPQVSLQSLK